MNIGVLALQGDFREHIQILNKLKVNTIEVRTKDHLKDIHGLIIPGGESTTIFKLLKKSSLDTKIKKLTIPIYGTCAGAILMAKKVSNPEQPSLNLIDIEVERNSYGRQLESFEEKIKIKNMKKPFPAVFIRAPKITKTSAEVLASHTSPVLVKKNNILISTFHPELTNDTRIHKLFLNMVKLFK